MRRTTASAPVEPLEGRTYFAITFTGPTDFPVGNSPSSAPISGNANSLTSVLRGAIATAALPVDVSTLKFLNIEWRPGKADATRHVQMLC